MKKTALIMFAVSGLLIAGGLVGGLKTASAVQDNNYFYNRQNTAVEYPGRGMMGWINSQPADDSYGYPRGMMGGRGWQQPLEEGETLDEAAALERAQEFVDLHNLDLVVGEITENDEGFFEIEIKDSVSGEVQFKLFADPDTGFVFPEYCRGNMGRFNRIGN